RLPRREGLEFAHRRWARKADHADWKRDFVTCPIAGCQAGAPPPMPRGSRLRRRSGSPQEGACMTIRPAVFGLALVLAGCASTSARPPSPTMAGGTTSAPPASPLGSPFAEDSAPAGAIGTPL